MNTFQATIKQCYIYLAPPTLLHPTLLVKEQSVLLVCLLQELNFVFFCKRDWWEIKVLSGSSMVIVEIKNNCNTNIWLMHQCNSLLLDLTNNSGAKWMKYVGPELQNFSSIHIQLSYSSCLLAGPLLSFVQFVQ